MEQYIFYILSMHILCTYFTQLCYCRIVLDSSPIYTLATLQYCLFFVWLLSFLTLLALWQVYISFTCILLQITAVTVVDLVCCLYCFCCNKEKHLITQYTAVDDKKNPSRNCSQSRETEALNKTTFPCVL